MVENINSNLPELEERVSEESIFGNSRFQFQEMIRWMKDRRNYELKGRITGEWRDTGDFFKGEGDILKRYDGNIFEDRLYILLEDGTIGKEDILIGRRIIEIKPRSPINPLAFIKEGTEKKGLLKSFISREQGENNPNIEPLIPANYVLINSFVRDPETRIFFRNQEFGKALEWLSSYINKYGITCHIEGTLVAKDMHMPCIITGKVKSVKEESIFIEVWDGFNPLDPLNDDIKEFISREWVIEVAQSGLNKIYPYYLLFEIGEELALTKKVLSVKNVKVVLDGRTIVHDVNFEINKGEILGIIGESGAGKSTTLKAILGEFPYSGEITVFGIDAHKTKEIAPFIGYVPQDLSRMYQNFNVLENIVAFGRQYGIPEDVLIQRGKSILRDLRIDHVANQPVGSLSGGQKRRASIAIAMVHNPRLLFLDEPTSGLDPLARYELWEHLDMINKEYGITLCVISHYLDEIDYCDKAVIFLKGIGFYDFNTPQGLKETLPGKGLALEVTLENVSIEAVDIIRNVRGVIFVIQRGERIRVLSELPSNILAQRVLKVLKENNISVHSVEYKVQIDMVDYFTYTTIIEADRRKQKTEDIDVLQLQKEKRAQARQLPDAYGVKDDESVVKATVECDEVEMPKKDIIAVREAEVQDDGSLIKKGIFEEAEKHGPKGTASKPVSTLESVKGGESPEESASKIPPTESKKEGSEPKRKVSTQLIWNANRKYFDSLNEHDGMVVYIIEGAEKIVDAIKKKSKTISQPPKSLIELLKKVDQIENGKPFFLKLDEFQQFDLIIQSELPSLADKVKSRYVA